MARPRKSRKHTIFKRSVNGKHVCLICSIRVSVNKRCNFERPFTQVHSNFAQDLSTKLRMENVNELKTTLKRQQSLFAKPEKKPNSVTEASFKVAHILTKHKKPFTDGGMMKEAMTAMPETLFRDHKSKAEIMSANSDVQLGANTVVRSLCAFCRCNGAVGMGHDSV